MKLNSAGVFVRGGSATMNGLFEGERHMPVSHRINIGAEPAPYDVLIGNGLLSCSGDLIGEELGLSNGRIAVVSSGAVADLYMPAAVQSMTRAGFEVTPVIIPDAEEGKRLAVIKGIYDRLAGCGFTRSDTIVALGGGSIGDAAGFAAATYMRGVRLVNIPTTLLSQADSSIGGKTAVNIDAGKNLVGAFHNPALVIEDEDVLETLPKRQFASGVAEIIKYACVADARMFLKLVAVKKPNADIIARCVRIKAKCVEKDQFDVGVRRILNFGHSVGHAIEAASGYTLLHGEAVAIGMVVEAKLGESLGITEAGTANAITRLCALHSLDTSMQHSEAAKMYIGLDKKAKHNGIDMMLLKYIGKAVQVAVPLKEICELL